MEELESFPDDVFSGESGCSEYDDIVNRVAVLGWVHRVIGYGFRETFGFKRDLWWEKVFERLAPYTPNQPHPNN